MVDLNGKSALPYARLGGSGGDGWREGWDIDGRFDKEECPLPPVQDGVCMGRGELRERRKVMTETYCFECEGYLPYYNVLPVLQAFVLTFENSSLQWYTPTMRLVVDMHYIPLQWDLVTSSYILCVFECTYICRCK